MKVVFYVVSLSDKINVNLDRKRKEGNETRRGRKRNRRKGKRKLNRMKRDENRERAMFCVVSLRDMRKVN